MESTGAFFVHHIWNFTMGQTAEELAGEYQGAREPLPIVIIGNGPVGMHAARELLEQLPGIPVVIYGDEKHQPYNRVRLSSWLAGDIDKEALDHSLQVPDGARYTEHIGSRIIRIVRDKNYVVDNSGRVQHYHKLVIATGSAPYIPGIPGIDINGMYTFRDLDDTSMLMERRTNSQHTVVLGGGLLGLEAARGMQPGNARVTVIEHSDRLLGQQLDVDASRQLQADVEALGIDVIISDGVAEILGEDRVNGIRLMSGRNLPCDTLIVATGIRPNIQLAKSSHLAYGKAIKVDDHMCTSDPDIYAVGECAEHRGKVYGLVAPGLEQASVMAADMAGRRSFYSGSVAASRLKVVGTNVFSMGPMGAGEDTRYGKSYVYRDSSRGIYRRLLVRQYRLAGAIGIGEWNESVRLQTTIGREEYLWPWQIYRFLRSGSIWGDEEGAGVASWPATATVCQCTGATRGAIGEAISFGACSVEQVSKATGASTVCGTCKPLVQDLLGSGAVPEPAPMYRTLLLFSMIALLESLLFFFAPALAYSDSVRNEWHWDILWRDNLYKQVSGFIILGSFVAGLFITFRKRTSVLNKLGSFDSWRMAHITLGLLVIIGLIAHTGFRMGNGLNFLLIISFIMMLIAGAYSSGIIALQHRIGGALATRMRRQSVLMHVFMFWPVPVLLGWHIFKTYWY